MTGKSSPEYAILPAGVVTKWGAVGAEVSALKPLTNCKAIGATGLTGGFVDCTTLIDTNKQSVSDLPDGRRNLWALLMIQPMKTLPHCSTLLKNARLSSFISSYPMGVPVPKFWHCLVGKWQRFPRQPAK